MGDITVKTRVLEQCRSTGGEDDYDLVDYAFSKYIPVSDAINHICEDKHKSITLEFVGLSIEEPHLYYFNQNEDGEFICTNHKMLGKPLRECVTNLKTTWVVAKKSQNHVLITFEDWTVEDYELPIVILDDFEK